MIGNLESNTQVSPSATNRRRDNTWCDTYRKLEGLGNTNVAKVKRLNYVSLLQDSLITHLLYVKSVLCRCMVNIWGAASDITIMNCRYHQLVFANSF